ncbi:class III lanthionine synthetase LanKC [Streptomyces rhizosphaerihabitans]|uniref:class III lanthionine synthetase LanKC n=1 Tax=Streptomyces rhizosphaerihabitans TaxID=1266770 RepID=UPI0021BEA334|nr:class III lanthionine synthetase LanKC [Streptomyces rhizosphaerihabitans]MCT9008003.1 class III lanthionine synthetase LanKC [Streptomyces rhizosphaerihabitans]
MDKRYEVYALADRHFYETPDRLSVRGRNAPPAYEAALREVPEGWHSARIGAWLTLTPADRNGEALPGPAQGWKVHASATRENAEKIATIVWDYCVPRGIPFKFVPGPHLLHLRNTKYAARDTSGKFVTIYPADEERLHQVLRELGALLDGFEGPYILTDLRWNEGPLYVRYGAFARAFVVDEYGSLVPAVRDGAGTLVPDRRQPSFRVPEWVTLPAFLEPQLAARNTTTIGDLPYRVEKALHFSNGGGVYSGTDTRDGHKVVLKEGRPHAGLAADGADAITRLEREKQALERVAGLDVVPAVRDWFTLGDHRFLVMDFLEGRPLNSFFAERHPLLTPEPAPDAVTSYTAWALRVHRRVEEAVEAVHARGIVFNDLHVFNIMVAPDGESVSLLDFEAAAPVEENGRQVVAHPGFFAPPDRRGTAVDRYALACLRLALFLPVTTLFVVDRGKAAHLAEVIAGQFPDVPEAFLTEAVAEITRDAGDTTAPAHGGEAAGAPQPGSRLRDPVPPLLDEPVASPARESGPALRREPVSSLPEPGDWPVSRDSMAGAILASATPERDDRLFPGDIAQFSDGGGLGLAHGAAGVLYALTASGAGRYEEGERWLLDHTDPTPAGTPLGLYDGLAGVVYVLEGLGHRRRALDLLDGILRERWQNLSSDLRGGLAGLGLVLGHLARTTGEPELAERAAEAAQIIVDRLTGPRPDAPRRRAGLLRGASGPALFLLRHYERTGDPGLLVAAEEALRRDLDRCVVQKSGALEVDEGWRTLPYLGDGSAGVGMVLDDLLVHSVRDPGEFERARSEILTAATSRFYAQPGLFQGRAGMILHLARTGTPGAVRERLAEQVAGLGWFAMSYDGRLAFPGHQMMRLSMDLGTGTAGCLLALGAALDGAVPAHLPFLPPLTGGPSHAAPHLTES